MLKESATDLYRLFFPRLCGGCDRPLAMGEEHLCFHCRVDLPFTRFELFDENPVQKVFYGRLPLEFATSLFFFSKGEKVQNILHNIKYNDHKALGTFVGKLFGERLQNNFRFNDVTTLVPVPLHPQKQHLRGFNQSELFASGMNEVMQREVQTDNLFRNRHTDSQTNKSRMERWENVSDKFGVLRTSELKDRHVLLIDDVLTTGATLEACAQTLLEAGCRVSVATVAYAMQ